MKTLFFTTADKNPYHWNAFAVLGLSPHGVTLRRIVSASRRREAELNSGRGPVIDGAEVDLAAIRAARDQLENPNTRLLHQLMCHRPHRQLHHQCQQFFADHSLYELLTPIDQAIHPSTVFDVLKLTPLQSDVSSAPPSAVRDVVLAAMKEIPTLRPGHDRFKAVLRRLPRQTTGDLAAALAFVKCQACIGLYRWDEAESLHEELEMRSNTAQQREAARQLRAAIRHGGSLKPPHATLRTAIEFVADNRVSQALTILRAYASRHKEPEADLLLAVCYLHQLQIADGIRHLKNAWAECPRPKRRAIELAITSLLGAIRHEQA